MEPFHSVDPDSDRVWWKDAGVHQNLTFPVHPDPVSGMHCWPQKVRVERTGPDDRYGDVFVDTNKSFQVYKQCLQKTRRASGPDGRRRPLWFARTVRPSNEAYRLTDTPAS